MAKKRDFECSRELQRLFNEAFAEWQKENRGGLTELARRCGVSPSYISHISRYGRIPGRPVLIHLGLNLPLKNPQLLYHAAGIDEPWPHDTRTALMRRDALNPGFLSLKVDMEGFSSTIREIVRSEIQPRRVSELTRGAPLRVGLNVDQAWLFETENGEVSEVKPTGFFIELMKALSMTLQLPIRFEVVAWNDFHEWFRRGELDAYGPVYNIPHRTDGALYMQGFCDVGIAAWYRKRKGKYLDDLPVPESLKQIAEGAYKIAVLKDTTPHYFANTRLGIPDERLIICENPDECFERIELAHLKRAAHLSLLPVGDVLGTLEREPKRFRLIMPDKNDPRDFFEDSIAVRPDWPELRTWLDEGLTFIRKHGMLQSLSKEHLSQQVLNGVLFRSYNQNDEHVYSWGQ